MGSINYSKATRPDTAYFNKIIENSLLFDWAIRIEFQSGESETSCWKLWRKTLFGIRSAETVLVELISCYTKNPNSTIRINAEKFRPQTRMLFTVYNPLFLSEQTEYQPQTSSEPLQREHDQVPLQIRLAT